MGERSDGEGPRQDNSVNKAAEHPARPGRPTLVKPKIEHVADMIVASQRRHFVEPEGEGTEATNSDRHTWRTPDVLMEDAAEDNIAGKTEPPRAVTVFQLSQIYDVIRPR